MSKEEGCSLFWLGLAILILIGSMRLSLGSLDNPGPGFLPFIAGLIMGVLAVIVYFQSRGATFSAKKIKGPLWTNPVAVKKVVFATLALFAYAVGMDYLGFLISTFIFLVFMLRAIEPQRWGLVILEALLASGASYFIFEILLQGQLPRGVLI